MLISRRTKLPIPNIIALLINTVLKDWHSGLAISCAAFHGFDSRTEQIFV